MTDQPRTRSTAVQRRMLENELFSFQDEKKSFEKKSEDVHNEIARTKKDIESLEYKIGDLEVQKNTYDHRVLEAEEEIARIKRKMNLL